MGLFADIVSSICIANMVFCIFLLIKNEITFRNQKKILDAIHNYFCDTCDLSNAELLFENMESYRETLWRLWDFGCKNILPKVYYEMIEPYID